MTCPIPLTVARGIALVSNADARWVDQVPLNSFLRGTLDRSPVWLAEFELEVLLQLGTSAHLKGP